MHRALLVTLPSRTIARLPMSYATTRTASYREMEVLSASPGRLLVMLFDHLVVQLQRAKIGIERDDIALRTQALGKARAIVSELLSTLDFEQGGPMAVELSRIYTSMLEEMVDVGMRKDLVCIGKLTFIATELRDGFHGAAEQQVDAKRTA
jgi:flagellar protein FliS